MRRALVLVASAALASCQGACPGAADLDAPPAADASDDGAAIGPSPARQAAVAPARCHGTDRGVRLEDGGGDPRDFDLGDGLARAGEVAVALVHGSAAGPVAAVALLPSDVAGVRIVDLGPTLGDAPAPQLALCRDDLVAASYRVAVRAPAGGGGRTDAGPVPSPGRAGGAGANRDLALYLVDSAEPARAALTVPQRRDDSLAFDLACSASAGLVVWDETRYATGSPAGDATAHATGPGSASTPASPAARGVIRAASFAVVAPDAPAGAPRGSATVRAGAVRDVSPPESDAEMPRVVPDGRGFFVLWIARRPEAASPLEGAPARADLDASPVIEATGEARAYGWLEMMSVDIAGNPIGPPRRLTSTTGHVSAYDVQARSDRAKPSVLVVVRDDQESVDGSGGTLWRVRAQDDAVEPPVELPTDGLGRGPPSFVDSPATWIAWVGPREQPRLLPLGASGEALARASVEEELDEARPLLSLSGLPSRPGPGAAIPDAAVLDARPGTTVREMLVASPGDPAAELRVMSCER